MFGVLPVARLLACSPAPASERLKSSGQGAGDCGAEVLLPVWGWDGRRQPRAGKDERSRFPEARSGGRSPDPKPSPAGSLAQQGAAPAPPGSPWRGGTFPTGSDPVQSGGTGAPQPVCQGNPSGCVLGGWGVGEKKKRWVRLESLRPPPRLDGPRPFPRREWQLWGSGETEEPRGGHGLGVTEPPRRPGGCGRRGRTTPAGAGAQKPAQAAVTGREPAGLGRLGGASRKRGPWAPLCEGRGRSTWQPRAAGSSDVRLAAGSPRCGPHPFPPGGTRLLSTLAGLFPGSPSSPTPPARAAVPIGRALPSLPHPPRVYALSPPPPVTSSSSPVGPSAPLHSPPQFADFLPPSAWSSRAAASGVIFSPTLVGVGEGETHEGIQGSGVRERRGWQICPYCAVCHWDFH
ncbi:ras-related protein Rap-2c isoform X2 [Callithrix jacchus]